MKITQQNIKRCIELIEQKEASPNMVSWSDKKFEQLSMHILDASEVSISVSTLKRICGKKNACNYIPSETTLNAISVYLGYNSWTEFSNEKNSITAINIKIRAAFIGALVLIIIGSFYLFVPINKSDDIQLSIKDSVSSFPHSAVIQYNISEKQKIHFGDRIIADLNPNQNTITHFYKAPFYYYIEVGEGNQRKTMSNLHLTNDDWTASLLFNNRKKIIPLSVSPFDSGRLYVSRNKMESNIPQIKKERNWINLTYSKVFDFDLKNKTITARVRNNSMKKNVSECNSIELFLMCANGPVAIKFTDESCHRHGWLRAGSQVFAGEKNDLSMMSGNISDWFDINIKFKYDKIEFYKNTKLVYELKSPKDLGLLKAINFEFTNEGMVDYINITNQSDTLFYDGFDR